MTKRSKDIDALPSTCPNCGDKGSHLIPAGLDGDQGFYVCQTPFLVEQRARELAEERTIVCPHCEKIVNGPTVPTHDWPPNTRQVCPGSGTGA